MENIELILKNEDGKILDIANNCKVKLFKITPFRQAELAVLLSELQNEDDLIKQVDKMHFIFSKIIEKIIYKDVEYDSKEFFNMLNITNEETQKFLALLIEKVIKYVFLDEEHKKK